jgi:DNA-binding NarL/FixJ family response regulator
LLNPTKPRILIADDHTLVAEGIAKILAPAYDIVAIAPNGRVVLEYATRLKPDLVCLDISMPQMNGIQTAVMLAEQLPKLKIIFVTQQLDLSYVRAAFRAGALGYVSKQSASNEILTAIQKVLRGGTFITPLLAEELVMSPDELARDPRTAFADPLTDRQRQVLQLIAEGKTVKEISDSLTISPKTVEFHKSSLMNELGLRTTAELTRYAVAHNIVSD